MPSISRLETGLIYRNPRPHLASRHAYFPSVVVLPDGELVAALDIGSAFEAVDVRSYVCRSTDGGRSWSSPALIFEPDESDHRVSTTCRISRMPDGQIVGATCLFDRTHADEGLSNPATEGFVRTQMAVVRSPDGGRTWTGPQPIVSALDWRHFETCFPIVAARAGRWLFPSSLWPDWQGRCPPGAHRAIAFVSDDGGKSWPKVVSVMDGSRDRVTAWEQKLITLGDGRLMAVCWCFDYKSGQNIRNRYAFSSDNAESFGDPLDSPLHGETCTPLALADNRILCVYRRVDQRGLWAHLAQIEGDAWRPLADAPLWGTQVESHDSGKSMTAQMSTLRFGCPNVQRLPDGDIFTAFWCVEDCVSNIRWLRLRVTE